MIAQSDGGLRARVQRLLNGDVRHEDLDRLFLYARDNCDGREPVQEVGDFVAHHTERTKGIVTRTVRDWCTSARFHVQMIGRTQGFDPGNLPSNFDEILRASFRAADAKSIRKVIGLSKAEVKQRLPAIINGFRRNIDGTMRLNQFYTRKEMKIINGLSKMLTAKPAFDNDRLFNDLAATLKSHGLLQQSEFRDFAELKPAVGLFAVAAMHNRLIRVEDDGTTIRLMVAPPTQKITIAAAVPATRVSGDPMFIATDMFITDIEAKDACAPDLLGTPIPWDFDIEITRERTLAKLG